MFVINSKRKKALRAAHLAHLVGAYNRTRLATRAKKRHAKLSILASVEAWGIFYTNWNVSDEDEIFPHLGRIELITIDFGEFTVTEKAKNWYIDSSFPLLRWKEKIFRIWHVIDTMIHHHDDVQARPTHQQNELLFISIEKLKIDGNTLYPLIRIYKTRNNELVSTYNKKHFSGCVSDQTCST